MKKEMKGVILAGGFGTRLHPLTVAVNKHLLPIGRKPMIEHCVEKLTEAGITNICIVTNPKFVSNFSSLLKSGKDYNCDITYKVQDGPKGIADALYLCKNFVGKANVTVLLGDNVFSESIKNDVEQFSENDECKLFFKHVPDGHRYGVGKFNGTKKLCEIEEKPSGVKGAYACIGIYIYSDIVFDFIEKAQPSWRNEIEITSVNNMFIDNNKKLSYRFLNGWWTDAGTFETLRLANEYAFQEESGISKE